MSEVEAVQSRHQISPETRAKIGDKLTEIVGLLEEGDYEFGRTPKGSLKATTRIVAIHNTGPASTSSSEPGISELPIPTTAINHAVTNRGNISGLFTILTTTFFNTRNTFYHKSIRLERTSITFFKY